MQRRNSNQKLHKDIVVLVPSQQAHTTESSYHDVHL
jgi:hypothetical protein